MLIVLRLRTASNPLRLGRCSHLRAEVSVFAMLFVVGARARNMVAFEERRGCQLGMLCEPYSLGEFARGRLRNSSLVAPWSKLSAHLEESYRL